MLLLLRVTVRGRESGRVEVGLFHVLVQGEEMRLGERQRLGFDSGVRLNVSGSKSGWLDVGVRLEELFLGGNG